MAPANLDFGRSFTFTTEDPDWLKKVLIGGAFTLACSALVGVPFVLGYVARVLRRAAAGAPAPLPEWDDLGGIFREGLRQTAVYLVHMLGVMAVGMLCFGVMLLPVLLSGGRRDPMDALGPAGALLLMALYALILIVALATAVYLPAAMVRAALADSVAAGLEWRHNLEFIRANLANYALALVSYLVAGFVAQFGVLLCCVGFFPAAFWSYLVLAVALGQTVRLASAPAS
jgi:hypothetical protein